MRALLPVALALASFQTTARAPKLDPKELVCVTTGNTDHPAGEIVVLDPATGRSRMIGGITPTGNERHATDVVFTADREQLLASIVELGEGPSHCFLSTLDPKSGRIVRSSASEAGLLDALCWAPDGRLLAVWSEQRPQALVVLDERNGAHTTLATLDARLWLRSLAFAPGGVLWGLHTPTPELDHDALVRLDASSGATLEIVKLDLGGPAWGLEIDASGRLLVTADPGLLHEIDPATGRSKGSVALGNLRAVGLERVH